MSYNFTYFYDREDEGSRKWGVVADGNECAAHKIIPMTIADLEFQTAPEIKEALKDYIDGSVLGYSILTEKYFNTISQHMEENYDYPLETEWIVPTAGIVPALATSVRAFTEARDGVIVFPPVYNPFYEVVEEQNREVKRCPLQLKNNRYEIDFELFEELAQEERNKLVFLCSPHNPGGRVWEKDELEKISKIASANNLIVISDEIHADMTLDNHQHYLYASISEEAAAHSIVCTSPSKSYNIAGLKSSNILISNPDLREKFEVAHARVGLNCPNVLGLKATEAAYQKAGQWFNELMLVLNKNVDLAMDRLKDINPAFKVMRPEASFLIWVNIEDFALSNADFMDKLESQDIYVTNGTLYGEEGEGWIRLNVGMPTEALEATLNQFEKLDL